MNRDERLAYNREKARIWYVKNRDREAAKRRERYRTKQVNDPHYRELHKKNTDRHIKNNRVLVIMRLGGKCVYCGCDEIPLLHINHKNADGKMDKWGRAAGLYRAILNGWRSTEDLEVACVICNWVHYMRFKGHDNWSVIWAPNGKALNTTVPTRV